jgi:hypothetical protein
MEAITDVVAEDTILMQVKLDPGQAEIDRSQSTTKNKAYNL